MRYLNSKLNIKSVKSPIGCSIKLKLHSNGFCGLVFIVNLLKKEYCDAY